MFTAQPPRYFIGSFTKSFSKLFFVQSSFPHQSVKPVGNGERETSFLSLLAWYFVKNLLYRNIDSPHISKVLSVIISFSVISTLPERISCFNSCSNFCKSKTYPWSVLSSSYVRLFFTSPLPRISILSVRRRQYNLSFDFRTGSATTESFILPSLLKYRSNAPLDRICSIKRIIA